MAREAIEELIFRVDSVSDPDLFRVYRIDGETGISRLFVFTIHVVCSDLDLSLKAIVGRNASLTMVRNGEQSQVFGMVSECAQGRQTEFGDALFSFTLVPRLNRLALSRQHEIFGTTEPISIEGILREQLSATELRGPGSEMQGRLSSVDYDFRLTNSDFKRRQIVQYEESDLDFISRLSEFFGIFYYFEHLDGTDRIIFGDSSTSFTRQNPPIEIRYEDTRNTLDVDEHVINEFGLQIVPLPHRCILRDYNPFKPHLDLTVETVVDPQGHGVVIEHGQRLETPDEGRKLVEIRAEELRCHSEIYKGTSNCMHLTAGHIFKLTDHYRSDLNREYVVTRLRHRMTMAQPGISDLNQGGTETSYRNWFECIPKSVTYRPRRITPHPMVGGLIRATIDAEGSGVRAELDSVGRYRIRGLYDHRDVPDGKASIEVDKLEPYGGANTGLHFPLRKGTNVMVGFHNGDPDRPVIVGALHNEIQNNVVTAKDHTKNRIRTSSGVKIEINDGSGKGSKAAGGDTE